MDNGSTVNVVFGGVLINNLVVVCVCFSLGHATFGAGWGGVGQ